MRVLESLHNSAFMRILSPSDEEGRSVRQRRPTTPTASTGNTLTLRAVLGAYCGMRECEIKALQWKDVDFNAHLLDIRRSKTPGGWERQPLTTPALKV